MSNKRSEIQATIANSTAENLFEFISLMSKPHSEDDTSIPINFAFLADEDPNQTVEAFSFAVKHRLSTPSSTVTSLELLNLSRGNLSGSKVQKMLLSLNGSNITSLTLDLEGFDSSECSAILQILNNTPITQLSIYPVSNVDLIGALSGLNGNTTLEYIDSKIFKDARSEDLPTLLKHLKNRKNDSLTLYNLEVEHAPDSFEALSESAILKLTVPSIMLSHGSVFSSLKDTAVTTVAIDDLQRTAPQPSFAEMTEFFTAFSQTPNITKLDLDARDFISHSEEEVKSLLTSLRESNITELNIRELKLEAIKSAKAAVTALSGLEGSKVENLLINRHERWFRFRGMEDKLNERFWNLVLKVAKDETLRNNETIICCLDEYHKFCNNSRYKEDNEIRMAGLGLLYLDQFISATSDEGKAASLLALHQHSQKMMRNPRLLKLAVVLFVASALLTIACFGGSFLLPVIAAGTILAKTLAIVNLTMMTAGGVSFFVSQRPNQSLVHDEEVNRAAIDHFAQGPEPT